MSLSKNIPLLLSKIYSQGLNRLTSQRENCFIFKMNSVTRREKYTLQKLMILICNVIFVKGDIYDTRTKSFYFDVLRSRRTICSIKFLKNNLIIQIHLISSYSWFSFPGEESKRFSKINISSMV